MIIGFLVDVLGGLIFDALIQVIIWPIEKLCEWICK